MSLNIFVLGLDPFNLEMLHKLPRVEQYRFHGLLSAEELLYADEIRIEELLDKARAQLTAFDGSIDAVVGYWDFPVSSMLPILCGEFGVRSPTLEAVVKCEHKYWSRLEQQLVINEYPRFALVDFDHPDVPPPGLSFPLWVKPVKSVVAELAFRVSRPEDYERAVVAIGDGVGHLGRPFDDVLSQLDLPPEIAKIGGQACLAEEALHGRQVTVEGYSLGGQVHVYGVVDSIRYPNSSSFLRYQYPSSLPESVAARMAGVSEAVIKQIGLDDASFNVEFFWDPARDTINLLEVNPRHSQSHARLFDHVDGVPNHECMVSVALGRTPALPHRQGRYAVAAKWFLRRFTDGLVTRCPSPAEVARVEHEVPGTRITIVARAGSRLSELARQDSYSYELADIHIGAADESELIVKHQRCVDSLRFEFQE